jgi:2-phospho-L-lactate guanylyltransferase (CobY/MobA/RfbA family)
MGNYPSQTSPSRQVTASEILSEEERSRLNHHLFTHTIDVLLQVDAISDILVVSRDSNVLTEAREKGFALSRRMAHRN